MTVSKSQLRVWNDKFNLEEAKLSIEKIIQAVRDDKDGLIFLPRRNGHINVYYRGTVILDFDGKNFAFNVKYFKYLSPISIVHFPRNGKFADFESWYEKLRYMKHAMTERNKSELEKGAQQKIMQEVNSNPNSKYYILDIEYDYPGIKYGRFDMIAVSKISVNGKHKIAVIELKHGTKAFAGRPTKDNEYGSGIVGHAFNFYRYIKGTEKESQGAVEERLRNLSIELASMSEICRRFALPPAPYLPELKEDDFDINDIQKWLLCVGCENIKTAQEGVLRYLGYPTTSQKNKINVRDKISPDWKLDYQVIQESYLKSLNESDFKIL